MTALRARLTTVIVQSRPRCAAGTTAGANQLVASLVGDPVRAQLLGDRPASLGELAGLDGVPVSSFARGELGQCSGVLQPRA